jgi:hypothetical protein
MHASAFGPDFITYDKIQQQWHTPNAPSTCTYTPPHVLGIYPLAAMLNHSCTANAIRTYANDTMIVHASKPIPAGTEIVWSYIPPTRIFVERRRELKKRHGFVCRCDRCDLESKGLRKDLLPLNLIRALDEASKWNKTLMDVHSFSDGNDAVKRQLCTAYLLLEETVLASSSLTNDMKRHLRVGYTNLHFNYFNAVLSAIGNGANGLATANVQQVRELVLNSATQLHLAFCASNNASTEHLSVLHLCYELIHAMHQSASNASANVRNGANTDSDSDQAKKIQKKVKFWTDAMKRAHMVRYGEMGSDLESVRKCLVHTRTVLRQKDGYLRVQHNFL